MRGKEREQHMAGKQKPYSGSNYKHWSTDENSTNLAKNLAKKATISYDLAQFSTQKQVEIKNHQQHAISLMYWWR